MELSDLLISSDLIPNFCAVATIIVSSKLSDSLPLNEYIEGKPIKGKLRKSIIYFGAVAGTVSIGMYFVG